MSDTLTVKYKTEQTSCGCCHQKLPTPKMSKAREFTISKSGAMEWTDWESAVEYQEDFESMVPDYIYDTINFHALDSHEHLVIEDSEIEKVKEFLLQLFSSKHGEQAHT
jgi:hypothetical protein